MQNLASKDNKIVRDFAMRNDKKDEFFHSSAYGAVQNSGGIGSASTGMTMEERKRIEEKRKFIEKYNNSNIFEETFNLRHSKKYTPKTDNEGEVFSTRTHNRENTTGDAEGNVRVSYGRTAGPNDDPYSAANTIKNDSVGIGGKPTGRGFGENRGSSGGYTPYRTGSAPAAPPRPSPASSFSANIKPSFK